MAPKQIYGRCSVFGCESKKLSTFVAPSSESLRNQWVHFVFDGNAPTRLPKCVFVCAKHFTDDCFFNLGQYRAGLSERLRIKPGSVPTLIGSATNLGQVSKLTLYHVFALLWYDCLACSPLECGCSISQCSPYYKVIQLCLTAT